MAKLPKVSHSWISDVPKLSKEPAIQKVFRGFKNYQLTEEGRAFFVCVHREGYVKYVSARFKVFRHREFDILKNYCKIFSINVKELDY